MNSTIKWPKCNAWWSGTFSEFLDSEVEIVVGTLASRAGEINLPPTRDTIFSWHESYKIMYEAIEGVTKEKPELRGLEILLEYEIPRRASRPDVIILAKGTALVIEFKVGSKIFPRAGQIQVAEYVLDLLDYHSASHDMTVIPALVATGASVTSESPDPLRGSLAVRNTAPNDVATLIRTTFEDSVGLSPREIDAWINAQYRPTPGILESAREVFAGNEVADIKHAYADNLDLTVSAIREVIHHARSQKKRLICFVTGVPGSGKTLTGLSAIHQYASGESEVVGAYLSGNGPLVDVLRYAIARDRHARDSAVSMEQGLRESQTLIQHIRDFFYSEFGSSGAPSENVIVFDEAQRAWNAGQMAKRGKLRIKRSQPDLALEIMTRCKEWSVIIAIVGEGQEINRGEAGISEWFQSLESYPSWDIYAALEMTAKVPSHLIDRLKISGSLHLKVGTRSPRAQNIADWAQQLLDGNFVLAAETACSIGNFPMLLTRDLQVARQFLADCATPDRRVGMLASSQDRRLRAYGIERSTAFIRSINWPQWFVEPAADVRSSYSLEVAASEFECQGLEIDWALVCWGSDLLWKEGEWVSSRFVGSNWQTDKQIAFSLNRYRVLLTRARHGMVIWVPENRDANIPFVNGSDLDKMAEILLASGFQSL